MTTILLPPPLLRFVLKRNFTWKLRLGYLQHFNNINSSFLGFKFLRKCLDNEIIPDFLLRGIDEKWWPSVIFYLNPQARCTVINLISRHKRKLEKLSERQDTPLKSLDKRSVRILDEVILPLWVQEVLCFGPEHPERDKFNEIHCLADIDSFLSELKLNRIPVEKLCEIEAAAKIYAKNVKQTPSDKGVEKARKYLKDNGLLAVPFDEGWVFV